MGTETVKNLIIGSGEAGKCLAWHFGKTKEQNVVVERRWIGGSCPNINCLPSKNVIWMPKSPIWFITRLILGPVPVQRQSTWPPFVREMQNGRVRDRGAPRPL